MNQQQFERAVQELRAGKEDIRPSDVVVYSEPLRSSLTQAIRLGRISLTDFSKLLEVERTQAQQLIALLVERHLFYVSAFTSPTDTYYETRLSASTRPMTRLRPDVWKKIDD
ncbi:MAG TPA: hypothetical protein VLX61_06085 [Anaerolineales bacterium]|nr:hypothetical protein [Anaerolineales bacterium]